MKPFCESYNLTNLIKQPTCLKNLKKHSCIDLILTNKPKSFQTICVIETELSDFHGLTVSVLKMHYRKLPLRITSYRDFSNYNNANLIDYLTEVLFEDENTKSFVKDPNYFYKVCTEVLNQHVPHKKKYVGGNNQRFINKALSKAIMQRFCPLNYKLQQPKKLVSYTITKRKKNILPI